MIKYNDNTINKWYHDGELIKVYYHDAVCYYKIDVSSPSGQTPCFAVVADISQYSDTEFIDVFNQADGKWYKLNNLSAYEEYGVYDSSTATTYYEGKLTIDGDYEYQYTGGSWVNVGAVTNKSYRYWMWRSVGEIVGSPSNYIQFSEFDLSVNGSDASLSYISAAPTGVTNETADNLFDNNISTKYCADFSSYLNTNYVLFNTQSAITPTAFAMTTANDSRNTGRYPKDWVLLGSNTSTTNWNDGSWNLVLSGTCGNEMYTNYTRFDYPISGLEEYPVYYTEKQDPPDNVVFSSMVEAESYECPWVGMHATIAGENYIFSGDSQSGYEWVNITLPYDAELQYLESSGSQYINTGVYLNTSNFEIGYTIVGKKQLFGYCHQGEGNGTWLGVEQSAIMFWGTNENNENISSYLASGENTVIFSPTGATINGSDISKSLSMGYDSIANIPLLVFARYNFYDDTIEFRGSDSYMKLKSFYVKNNGTLVLDLIPVRVGQVGYMFDRVSWQLFGNAGTGSFILGPDRTLPTGYTEVEYIENNSLAYIDTGFKPNQDTRIIAEMQCVTSTNYNQHFGCGQWDNYNGIRVGYEVGITGTLHVKYGTNNSWTVYSNVTGDYNVHTYDWNKNEFYVDNTLIGSVTYDNFQTTDNLGIFFVIEGNVEPSSEGVLEGRAYSFKIYDDGTLVRDLVPCIDPNNVVGMYDIVGGAFYSSANADVFVAGPAV